MKRIIILIALLFIITRLNAQDTLNLSLQEALKYGLANNKTIQASALNTELNGYKIKEFNSAFYPSITGNLGVTNYFNVPVQYIPANTFNPSAPSDQYLGIKLLLPDNSSAGLSANWTIYNQAIFSALKIVKTENEASTIQFQKDKSDLAFSIGQLYYGIVFAEKQEISLYKIDSNINKLIIILQSNYDYGVINKTELDQVKINKANNASQIADLKLAIETQTRLLKLFMGLPVNTNIKLTLSDIENLLQPVTTSSASIESNYDFQLMESQIKLSRLERKSIFANYIPSLSLAYNYTYNWYSSDLDKLLSSNFKTPQQFIGVNISVPIFDGNKNLYRLKQNSVKSKQLELQSEYLSDRISADISNAQLKYNASLQMIGANDLNVRLAEDIYTQSLFEYQQGTIPLSDVLTIENSFEQALMQYFKSVSNALTALLEYKKATNTILTK